MEIRRTERDQDITDTRREGMAPVVESYDRSAPLIDHNGHETATRPPIGPRVRWGGVMSGFVMALGILLLLTALGLAIGISALGDPRTPGDAGATASGLGIGAGVWTAIALLLAHFLGGMVSTRVTDRPDRGGAVIHGTLVWTLCSVFVLWLLGQGVSLGLSNLFGALGGLTRTAVSTVTATATGDSSLSQSLGLTDSTRIIERLDNPATASLFATLTGTSTEQARTALSQLRSRIEPVRDNPERVAAEVRAFLEPYGSRVEQQARQAAATVQEGATVGAWVTFGVLVLTLLAAIFGALAGIPSLRQWRARWTYAGAA